MTKNQHQQRKKKLRFNQTISSFFTSKRPTKSQNRAIGDSTSVQQDDFDSANSSTSISTKEPSLSTKTVLHTHCICNLPLSHCQVTCTESQIQNFGKTYLFCQRKLLKPVGVDKKTLSRKDLLEYKQACAFYLLFFQ
jgi:hypothetical protein